VGLREPIQLNYCSDDESTGFLNIPKYPLEPQTAEILALGCFNLSVGRIDIHHLVNSGG